MKIGIIGCGRIAQMRHIPEYDANPVAELYGFYDLNAARATEIAAKYGGHAFASIDALLADPAIDAVSVLTPNSTHADISIRAMRAGKHVLCEKPMAVTLEQCDAMVATAKETGRVLMIGQNQRITPAHIKAKELIAAGEIGRPISFMSVFSHGGADNWSIDGNRSWFMDKSLSCFGAIADLGVHKTDLVQYLLDDHIVSASAYVGTLDKKDADGKPLQVDDNAICIYTTEKGAVGTVYASWTNYGHEDNSTVIYGTEGVLSIYRDPAHSIVLDKRSGETVYYDTDTIQTNDHQTSSGIIDLFVDSVQGRIECPITAQSVLCAMKAVFACKESAEEDGLRVYIP